ncbi:MAG TPA: hypothetical protein VI757_03620 [Bacteroidia bacterium]|nr:hypothetical protein [Bacteroidia bacterium]
MRSFIFLITLLLSLDNTIRAQPFSVTIADEPITAMPGIHSFAFAESNGKWLFIGGRINGLHGFLTPFAFQTMYANTQITVVDPVANQSWSSSTSTLPDSISEPITSTNMEYYLDSNTLYMAGGYGWKNSINDFVTFPTLTAIDLNGLMNAVINGTTINSYFRQITDTNLAIAGAHLEKLDTTFYLVFGHRFNSAYHQVDSFNVQKYSNAIRTFQINDDGINLSITNFQQTVDTANFHRRDYNLVPQIFPDRQFGFTAFSGVFRYGINQPFLNSVDIKPMLFSVNNSFTQNLSNYESAVMPVYDSLGNIMHSVFFGGMSLYYVDTITQQQVLDTLVPFVSTISRVQRNADSSMTEYVLPARMPGYYGSNALFIPVPGVNLYNNSIISMNALSGVTKVGYIVGGINSPDRNISATNPESSSASTRVFAVYIDMTVSVNEIKLDNDMSDFIVYPNGSGSMTVEFVTRTDGKVSIELFDSKGALLANVFEGSIKTGEKKTLTIEAGAYSSSTLFCRMRKNGFSKVVKVAAERK